MFGGCLDVSAEVELIDLSEGDDVDPIDVTAADLRENMEINGEKQPWPFAGKKRGEQRIKLCKSHTVGQ